MAGATAALYEPLIERNLDAVPAAAAAFLEEHSLDDLWVSVARFAVLAWSPSLHATQALVAARAVHDLRDVSSDRQWRDLVIECARYAAEVRQPWSEPPLLDPPAVDPAQPRDLRELEGAVASGDRERAERWLAARVDDRSLHSDLRALPQGDAILLTDSVLALASLLGETGRYALLRVALWNLVAQAAQPAANREVAAADSLRRAVEQAIERRGAIDAVQAVLVAAAAAETGGNGAIDVRAPAPYRLARDYAHALIARAMAPRLRKHVATELVRAFIDAVDENLEHGESFADWSLA